MSRLARHYEVIFVEEPVKSEDGDTRFDSLEMVPGVTVLTPRSMHRH